MQLAVLEAAILPVRGLFVFRHLFVLAFVVLFVSLLRWQLPSLHVGQPVRQLQIRVRLCLGFWCSALILIAVLVVLVL